MIDGKIAWGDGGFLEEFGRERFGRFFEGGT